MCHPAFPVPAASPVRARHTVSLSHCTWDNMFSCVFVRARLLITFSLVNTWLHGEISICLEDSNNCQRPKRECRLTRGGPCTDGAVICIMWWYCLFTVVWLTYSLGWQTASTPPAEDAPKDVTVAQATLQVMLQSVLDRHILAMGCFPFYVHHNNRCFICSPFLHSTAKQSFWWTKKKHVARIMNWCEEYTL